MVYKSYDEASRYLEKHFGRVYKFTEKRFYAFKVPAKTVHPKLETIENVNSINQQSYELKDNFGVGVIVNLVTEEDLRPIRKTLKDDIAGGAYTEAFEKKSPTAGKQVWFSRIGFDKLKTQALVHVGYSCGHLCGYGHFVLLTKYKDGWKIKKKMQTWIS